MAITSLLAISATGALAWWVQQQPSVRLEKSVPGMDGRSERLSSGKVGVKIGEFFQKYDGQPATDLPGEWTNFRGHDFDNICKQKVKLADKWPAGGPPILWRVKLGEGHAAPVIKNGRVYLLDYDEQKRMDSLRCFSLRDGKEIWRRSYKVRVKRNHGMSRTVPFVTDKYVVTIGPKCQVMCVDAVSGDFKWGIDMVATYGTKVPLWYTGQCVFVDGDTVVLAPGGKEVLLTGVDIATGKVLWTTPNPGDWQMSHSSVMPMTIDGRRMYVYAATGGLIAVDTGDKTGQVLWQTTAWSHNVIAPSPLLLPGNRIFLTAGYGAGSMVVQVNLKDGKYDVEVLKKRTPREGLALEQQTAILYRGRVFGILPKDAGPLRKQFVCYSPDDLGKVLWSSGKTKRFGLGPFIVADGKFYILDDDGVLAMASATADRYEELDRAKVLNGHDSWGPLAIAGTRMLLRDSTEMVCIDIGGGE